MVKKFEKQRTGGSRTHIKADVIILGCSLPGIVTAHKLKKKFGNTMDIVVLDLPGGNKHRGSKNNVAFIELDEDVTEEAYYVQDLEKHVIDNVARHFLAKYAKDFNIPLPDAIMAPDRCKDYALNKLFQYRNGNTVYCKKDYHDFDYLNFLEKFELCQFQAQLEQKMRDLFQSQNNNNNSDKDRRTLLSYDQTTMEKHICDALLFPTSREIMRTTVRLVCGAPSDSVSVLFYLHQCYRTNSTRNHVDGDNTRFREKLLGYCRKRLTNKLQQSIADITVPTKQITEIRTYSDEQVILETLRGETDYVCNLLAMALRPDELNKIRVEDQLIRSEKEVAIACSMTPGQAKKFIVQYEQNFWREDGYSGDILSIRGPIIWAMERPRMSTTGSQEKYAALIGYLKFKDDVVDSREAVLDQLVKLFGEKAKSPVTYKESYIADIFVPRCGDYVALRRLTAEVGPKHLEWGALDIFADGDVAAALEAGHNAYMHLLTTLRPQAQTFDDARAAEWPTVLNDTSPLTSRRAGYFIMKKHHCNHAGANHQHEPT